MVYDLSYIKDRVIVDPKTNCWNWTKSTTHDGYGQFVTTEQKSHRAHRFVFEQVNGTLAAGLVVRHNCHNPLCCNPEHLKSGTDKDNWHDSAHKHRATHAKMRLVWIVNDVTYSSSRQATKATGLSPTILTKYTNTTTRVFDVVAYRLGCDTGNKIPKV